MIQFPRYLPDQNALAVAGIPTPFPAGSLIAVRQDDMLAIASPVDGTLICQWASFDAWAMADETVFGSADAAFAVLDAACRQKRPVGSPLRSYAVPVTADGQSAFAVSPAPADVNTISATINGIAYFPPTAISYAPDTGLLTWSGPFDLVVEDEIVLRYT